MDSQEERLLRLDRALTSGQNICSSGGILTTFPPCLKNPFPVNGVGLIVCRQGRFTFLLNQKLYTAKAGETLFIPEDTFFQAFQESDDMEVYILIYRVEPIRDAIGNSVASMYLYSRLTTDPCYVWETGEEEEVVKYMLLLDSTLRLEKNTFNHSEQKLLLLALTYRLCSVYNRKISPRSDSVGYRYEIFLRLVQLVDEYYMQQRGVEFYADKLCLSSKYLSVVSKSICGYTVQDLVFKAIIRKSVSLLKNTQKSIQEIADELNFPNASYFGSFFKRQMGMSPQQYRKQ